MELEPGRPTRVLPDGELGVVLTALSKALYEPLPQAFFKHLTRLFFLLAMASARNDQMKVCHCHLPDWQHCID